jgi:pyrroloquinoline quinone biosynthesis protein D
MDLTAIPRLSTGCRMHRSEAVLLLPEGALKLTGPAREILLRVDGTRSVGEIIGFLLAEYPEASAAEVERDILSLLDRMQQRGVLRV